LAQFTFANISLTVTKTAFYPTVKTLIIENQQLFKVIKRA